MGSKGSFFRKFDILLALPYSFDMFHQKLLIYSIGNLLPWPKKQWNVQFCMSEILSIPLWIIALNSETPHFVGKTSHIYEFYLESHLSYNLEFS